MEKVMDLVYIDEYRPLRDVIDHLQNVDLPNLKKKYPIDDIITYRDYCNDTEILSFNKKLEKFLHQIREYINKFHNHKRNVYIQNLLIRYQKLMMEYSQWYDEIKNRYIEMNKRAYLITHDEQLNDYLSQPQTIDTEQTSVYTENILPERQIYRSAMIQRDEHDIATNRVADIADRHNQISKLVNDITELNQLFLDMSVLVQSQEEPIGQIAVNVAITNEEVQMGKIKLDEAKKLQSSSRKKVCCILLVIIIIVIVIVSIIVPSTIYRV